LVNREKPIHGQQIASGHRPSEAAQTKAQTRQGEIDQEIYLTGAAITLPSAASSGEKHALSMRWRKNFQPLSQRSER